MAAGDECAFTGIRTHVQVTSRMDAFHMLECMVSPCGDQGLVQQAASACLLHSQSDGDEQMDSRAGEVKSDSNGAS